MTTIDGTKRASSSTVSFRFSSTLTTRCVGASSRMRSTLTSFVPPTLGMLRTTSRGWMQKPVRPTSCEARPRSQSSSVTLGTSETMRASLPATGCSVPTASTSVHYMFRRYSPPTA